MADWRDIHADANFRLAQKMLEQQGEINDLRAERDAARRAHKALQDEIREWSPTKLIAQIEELMAERDALREHILDIDAHATPYEDLPDDPGYVGLYLLTSGALHRALGKVGHTAVPCRDAVKVTEVMKKLEDVERERDALKAAHKRLGELIESYPPGSDFARSGAQALFRRMHALDTPSTPESLCPRCEGSKFEPGTEAEGDWDSAAMRHHPPTGEPCAACDGTGTTPESPESEETTDE